MWMRRWQGTDIRFHQRHKMAKNVQGKGKEADPSPQASFAALEQKINRQNRRKPRVRGEDFEQFTRSLGNKLDGVWAERIRRLASKAGKENAFVLGELCRSLAKQPHRSKEAYVYYHRMKTLGKPRAELIHNAMMSSYARTGDVAAAEGILQEMEEEHVPPSVYTFTTLVSAYAKAGRLKEAQALLDDRMVPSGCIPTVATWNALLDGYARQGDAKNVQQRMLEAEARGVTLDGVSFASLMFAHVRSGEMNLAIHVLREMRSRGLTPSVVIWGSLLHGFAKHGDKRAAESVWQHMKRLRVKPNRQCFDAMISACSRSGSLEASQKLVDEMRAVKIAPSLLTYNLLINGYARLGLDSKCFETLKHIRLQGLSPDRYTYNSLLYVLIKVKDMGQAKAILSHMRQEGIEPNAITWSLLVQSLLHGGPHVDIQAHTDEPAMTSVASGASAAAWNILDLAESTGDVTHLDTALYNMVLRVFCNGVPEDVKDAIRLFDRMQSSDRAPMPNAKTYGIMVRSMLSNNHMDEAFDYAEKGLMHIPPSLTLLDMLPNEALQMWMEKAAEQQTSILRLHSLLPKTISPNDAKWTYLKEIRLDMLDALHRKQSYGTMLRLCEEAAPIYHAVGDASLMEKTLVYFLMEMKRDAQTLREAEWNGALRICALYGRPFLSVWILEKFAEKRTAIVHPDTDALLETHLGTKWTAAKAAAGI